MLPNFSVLYSYSTPIIKTIFFPLCPLHTHTYHLASQYSYSIILSRLIFCIEYYGYLNCSHSWFIQYSAFFSFPAQHFIFPEVNNCLCFIYFLFLSLLVIMFKLSSKYVQTVGIVSVSSPRSFPGAFWSTLFCRCFLHAFKFSFITILQVSLNLSWISNFHFLCWWTVWSRIFMKRGYVRGKILRSPISKNYFTLNSLNGYLNSNLKCFPQTFEKAFSIVLTSRFDLEIWVSFGELNFNRKLVFAFL